MKIIWLRSQLVAHWLEIIGILLLCTGYAAYISTKNVFVGAGTVYINYSETSYTLLYNAAWNSGTLALMIGLLHWRAWKPSDLKIKINGRSTLEGVILMVVTKIGYTFAIFGIYLVVFFYRDYTHYAGFFTDPQSHFNIHAHPAPNWIEVIGANILNAYAEEIPMLSYAFNQFAAKHGPFFALILTTLLRISYHTYQGIAPTIALSAIFLIFGIYYWRTRNVWPVIMAHILYDTIG